MLARQLPNLVRHKAAITAAACLAATLLAGTAAVLVGGGSSGDEPVRQPYTSSSIPYANDSGAPSSKLADTSDPESFVVSVASALFDWDTSASTPLAEYTNRLLDVADPTGEETPGLLTDLTTYLPSSESWADLKTYSTRQWIDINSYEIPGEWKRAEFNGETTDLAPGTTAYTITGLRRRSGIWQGKPAHTVDKVSFTMFIVCKPTYDTCRLLRLSQLNNPLH